MHDIRYAVCGNHHSATLYSLLVDGDDDGVGGDDTQVGVGIEYPMLYDVLEFVGILTHHLLECLGLVLIVFDNLLERTRTNTCSLARTGHIFYSLPVNRHGRTVVSRTLHLVNVPVGLQIRKVAHTGIGTYALSLLTVPEGEGVVVAIGKDDGSASLVERIQVVHTEVATSVTSTPVVVVPRLAGHLYGHQQAQTAQYGTGHIMPEHPAQPFCHSSHSHACPYGKGVEGASIGIVSLTRLHRCLVEIDDDSKASHEKEEEDYTKLLLAQSVVLFVVTEELPEQTHESEYQRQTIEDIVPLVGTKFRRQFALVAQTEFVQEGNTRYPVAMLPLSVALQVILTSGKVPHEITPVHEVDLITQEETQILQHGWSLHLDHISTALV